MHIITGNPEQLLLQEHYDEGLLAQALLDYYYAPLLRLAYSLVGDSALADDIVQETLLVALDKIDQYEPGTDLKAWLCRIAIFTSRNTIRRRKLREKWYRIWTRVAALGSPPRTYGAAVDIKNDKDQSPLDVAANDKLAEMLREAGAQ